MKKIPTLFNRDESRHYVTLERFLRQHPNLPGIAVSLNADDSDIPGHALRLLIDILLLAYKRIDDADRCDYHKGYDAAMRECESPPPVLLSVRAYNELPADRRAIVDEWLQANGLHVNHVGSVVNATTVKALMLDAHGNIKTTEDGDSAYHLVTVSPFPAGVLAKL